MKQKQKAVFVCSKCGYESLRWEGQCRGCREWNTFQEVEIPKRKARSGRRHSISPIKLSSIDTKSFKRLATGINELDRTLGGGLVLGQVVLIGGTPGIGKSTLLLQLASVFAGKVLYVSGEESEAQIALRADRLDVDTSGIDILADGDIDVVSGAFSHDLLIIDSIQVMESGDLTSAVGSVSQVRECAARVISIAKSKNIPALIVGHITKDGAIAGPKTLEHMVDTILYLEGDRQHMFRLLRVQKNRFGDDTEVGIFQMDMKGLQGVKNPAEALLSASHPSSSGTAIAMVLEGSRPLAVEVQALTTKTSFGYPKRAASGFSLTRLQLLCAVIQKRLKINLLDQDVYVNIASGLNIREPAVDLAVCAAIISSYNNKPVGRETVFFGEVGLSGEVRNVMAMDRRFREAKKLGFRDVVSPKNTKSLAGLAPSTRG